MVDRNTYIGGADAAPIAGVGLWASPYSVWAKKVGLVQEDPSEVTERMQWGLLLEKPVAEEWARREKITHLRRATFRRHPEIPYIGGHPDFFGTHPTDGPIVIETKLSDRPSEWEDDEVPLQYYLQVQHYLVVTGIDVAYIVVLLRGNEMRSFRIPRDQTVIDGLLEAYADFWNLVQAQTPPEVDGHEATAETLKRRFPRAEDSEMVADLPVQSLIEGLIAVRRDAKEYAETATAYENQIKDRMGTVARLLSPGVVITWKNNKDSVKTDWESVAKGYRRLIEEAALSFDGRLNPASADLDAIESIHTNTIPGARPFRVTLKAEE